MSNIAPLIDDFALLKAQMADLEEKIKPLRDQIEALGEGAYEGTFYRVTVSKSERANLDSKAVRKKLSRQFIQANTTYTPVTTVRVTGRTAVDVKTEG
ncbi:hypothetical protein ACRQ5Q_14710 [Bradyrhizobium sp. PMVTL-01]|uniref:hypothetical protein n=1 Tax=Bradyrhizobium sp. PMVTL-01 TaxID=3434999 RepID=UPI003F6F664D